jgi:hypothetical protein
MTKPSLLHRQIRLLEYLTSGSAIFGDDARNGPNSPPEGIDIGRLRLEAHFSHEKRIDKIVAVYPRTFSILGGRTPVLLEEFARARFPTHIDRLSNAEQFCNFLHSLGPSRIDPPYLLDLASCELAYARSYTLFLGEQPKLSGEQRGSRRIGGVRKARRIRRRQNVALVRCAYDVRSLFTDQLEHTPPKRDMLLAVSVPLGSELPEAFELHPVVFDLLLVLDDWTDPTIFGAAVAALLPDLYEPGLIEDLR